MATTRKNNTFYLTTALHWAHSCGQLVFHKAASPGRGGCFRHSHRRDPAPESGVVSACRAMSTPIGKLIRGTGYLLQTTSSVPSYIWAGTRYLTRFISQITLVFLTNELWSFSRAFNHHHLLAWKAVRQDVNLLSCERLIYPAGKSKDAHGAAHPIPTLPPAAGLALPGQKGMWNFLAWSKGIY